MTFPYTPAAGGTRTAPHEADLPDGTTRTNIATATQQLFAYDEELTATPTRTTDHTGTASVDATDATITHVDDEITSAGPWGLRLLRSGRCRAPAWRCWA